MISRIRDAYAEFPRLYERQRTMFARLNRHLGQPGRLDEEAYAASAERATTPVAAVTERCG